MTRTLGILLAIVCIIGIFGYVVATDNAWEKEVVTDTQPIVVSQEENETTSLDKHPEQLSIATDELLSKIALAVTDTPIKPFTSKSVEALTVENKVGIISLPGNSATGSLSGLTIEKKNALWQQFEQSVLDVLHSASFDENFPLSIEGNRVFALSAGGVMGEEIGLIRKVDTDYQFAVVSLHYTAKGAASGPNEPYVPECPCTLEYSIFISDPVSFSELLAQVQTLKAPTN